MESSLMEVCDKSKISDHPIEGKKIDKYDKCSENLKVRETEMNVEIIKISEIDKNENTEETYPASIDTNAEQIISIENKDVKLERINELECEVEVTEIDADSRHTYIDKKEDEESNECTKIMKSGSNADDKKTSFAIPALPVHKYSKTLQESSTDEHTKLKRNKYEIDNSNTTQDVKGTFSTRKEIVKGIPCKCPYKEPIWGGAPSVDKSYSLTILKNGIVKDNVDLSEQSIMVFGRSHDCGAVMEHPSCSRYHAILQYCTKEKDIRKLGYYLYDLGSTHGTFVNKEQVKAKVYVRIRVGYQIRFGGSSRLYIMEGPGEDQEEELDIDFVRQSRLQLNKKKATDPSRNEMVDDNDEGASWGFREDAEEEGLNLKDLLEKKKNVEVKDPKKTLKGFFEREGIDFEYEMSQRAKGSSVIHVAQVRLPIETSGGIEVIAEGISSNKKDAVLNCATDACKLIQAYDIMQNSTQEDLYLKRQRELEANDFYDSDDDNYLDRTGSVEIKRLKRIKRAGKVQHKEIETHDSLKTKLAGKEKSLSVLEEKLSLSNAACKEEEDDDSLDAYMSLMKNKLDKKSETAIKVQIAVLKKEIASLNNLVELTHPALPAFDMNKGIVENDTKDLTKSSGDKPNTSISISDNKKQVNVSKVKEEIKKTSPNQKQSDILPKKKKRIYGPGKPPEKKSDDNFVGWLPPENQSGDGRTHLNEKLGY